MKYIKLFEDIDKSENVVYDYKAGKPLPNNDPHLILINDLILELTDSDFIVKVKGYYAYHEDHIVYDIIVNKTGTYEIFDIKDPNDINIDTSGIERLNNHMKDILTRLLDNGLYLGSYSVNMEDTVISSFSRLFKRIDGKEVHDFIYNDPDENY